MFRHHNYLKIIILSVVFISFSLVKPNLTLACCSDSQCGVGGLCNNIPANCGLFNYGEGTCVNGYETCSVSSDSSACLDGEVCGKERLCHPGGGSTGGGAYQYPTCGGGTLFCGDPALYPSNRAGAISTDGGYCAFKATCGNNYFPSSLEFNNSV